MPIEIPNQQFGDGGEPGSQPAAPRNAVGGGHARRGASSAAGNVADPQHAGEQAVTGARPPSPLSSAIQQDAPAADLAALSAQLDEAYLAGTRAVADRDAHADRVVELARQLTAMERERERDAALSSLHSMTGERDHAAAFADRLQAAMPAVGPQRETSASIAAWQTETFGTATTTWERAERSDDAMMEAMMRVYDCDLSQPRPNLARAIRAAEELAELIVMLVERDDDPVAVTEVADVQIVLAGIPAAHGLDVQVEVDAKMAINRARTWQLTGDGHGQHVEKP